MPGAPPACSVHAPRVARGHRIRIYDLAGAAKPVRLNTFAPCEPADRLAEMTGKAGLCALPAERHGLRGALHVTAGPAVIIMHLFGTWLFASGDTEAGWRGWQVVERLSGLSRRYRDPRFDTWTKSRP